MKKSILLAVDGSSGGGKALRHVLATIDPETVGIVLAYVIEWSPYSFNTPEENAERHKRRESEISRAKAGVVAPAKAELEAKGFNVSAVVRHGPPAETLINLAHEYKVAEITIGRRGQSGIKSLLFGSVAGSLMQTSDIPGANCMLPKSKRAQPPGKRSSKKMLSTWTSPWQTVYGLANIAALM